MHKDIGQEPSRFTLEPFLTLAAVARATHRIGLVTTALSTFNEPYNLARMFKTRDVMSHGRAGWNVVPTADPVGAANFGTTPLGRHAKYERLHEVVQIIQQLWGSWGKDAWIKDQKSGRYADASKIQPINFRGRHVGSRGPLPIPPSEQGQPVIFQAGGGHNGALVAGRYASGVIGAVFTIEDAIAQRASLRKAAKDAGRNPDEIRFFAGVMPALGETNERRSTGAWRKDVLPSRLPYPGQMLGLPLSMQRIDQPLSEQELAAARPSPYDPRAVHALAVARRLDATRSPGLGCDRLPSDAYRFAIGHRRPHAGMVRSRSGGWFLDLHRRLRRRHRCS